MRYFKVIEEDPSAENYEQPVAVYRMDLKADPPIMDWWNGEKWIWRPRLVAFSGMGGDNEYYECDEEEAQKIAQMVTERSETQQSELPKFE